MKKTKKQKKNRKNIFRLAIVVMLLLVLAVMSTACGSDHSDNENDAAAMAENSEGGAFGDSSQNDEDRESEIVYEIASGECGENATWLLTSDGTMTISGSGSIAAVEDSETYAYGFSDEIRPEIKSVVIEDGITEIGWRMFQYCENMKEIDIPDSVETMGTAVFGNCASLEKLNISEYITDIEGNLCGGGCDSLEEITVDSNNPKYCSVEGALYSKDMTELLAIPGVITEFEIPASVTNLYVIFSSYSNLERITVEDGNPECIAVDGALYTKDMKRLGAVPGATENFEVPEGVEIIALGAFSSCKNLKTVTLPEGVKVVEYIAFSGCSNLESIMLPESLTNLSEYAFLGCSSLSDIYYAGTQSQWENITVFADMIYSEDESENETEGLDTGDLEGIDNAEIHYNSRVVS